MVNVKDNTQREYYMLELVYDVFGNFTNASLEQAKTIVRAVSTWTDFCEGPLLYLRSDQLTARRQTAIPRREELVRARHGVV